MSNSRISWKEVFLFTVIAACLTIIICTLSGCEAKSPGYESRAELKTALVKQIQWGGCFRGLFRDPENDGDLSPGEQSDIDEMTAHFDGQEKPSHGYTSSISTNAITFTVEWGLAYFLQVIANIENEGGKYYVTRIKTYRSSTYRRAEMPYLISLTNPDKKIDIREMLEAEKAYFDRTH